MPIEELTEQLLLLCDSQKSQLRPLIVAIDGLSGSGKTTLAKKLELALQTQNSTALILHIDDYIENHSSRYGTGKEEWFEYYHLQWKVDKLKEQLFQNLCKAANSFSLDFYHHSSDSHVKKRINLSPYNIVIIEGIFLQRKEWRAFYDFIVFMDCSRKLRYERVLERDSYIGDLQERLSKYQRRYWPGEDYYLRTETPSANADLVYKVLFNSY